MSVSSISLAQQLFQSCINGDDLGYWLQQIVEGNEEEVFEFLATGF